jgi:hypothetical protein
MAKLEGVKVLDMKYGEILRVEYDGEIYEKVDGPAQKGDLIYVTTSNFIDATKNAFYKCAGVDSDGNAKFSDDIDDIVVHHSSGYKIFRKVATQPSLADRVAALEARVDKLEGKTDEAISASLNKTERPTVGDFVKVIQNGIHHAEIGDYAKIVENDKSDIPFKCEDLNGWNVGWFREDEVEKVTDENALKFLRIGRKPSEFKVGDIVRGPEGNSAVDIFEIIEIREGSAYPIRFINRNGVNDGFNLYADLTLIAPVEARVDRP